MNTKRFSKILAVALAFVLCFAMAMPAFAEGTDYKGMVEENQTYNLNKYLLMDEDVTVPAVDFTFTIVPGAANTTGTFPVFAGQPTPTVTDGGVSFKSSSSVYTTAQTGDTVTGLVEGKQYAKETAVIDFSSVVFPEPGVYRYIITEEASNYPGITNDTVTERVLDVYVEDATVQGGDKLLKIAGYVLHTNKNAAINAHEENLGSNAYVGTTKSTGFTNVYDTHDLSFSKTVDGNQASRDKYFKFTVTIEGALKSTEYTVDISGADATSGSNSATKDVYRSQENVDTFTTDGNGKAELTFYLQHGQTITIKDLPEGATWTIEEDEEDYVPSVVVSGDTTATGDENEASDSDGITADTTAAFKNYRNGTVPTGVLLTVAPFAVIMLVGIAGVAFVVLKKKRASAE